MENVDEKYFRKSDAIFTAKNYAIKVLLKQNLKKLKLFKQVSLTANRRRGVRRRNKFRECCPPV